MGYAKTLRQIVNLTLRFANDYTGDYLNGKSFTVQEVRNALNLAILDLAIETGLLKGVSLIIPSEDTQVYTLPADCIRPIQFMLNGINGTLILPRQVSQFDQMRDPISDSGDPVRFYRDKNLSYNQVGFVPIPSQDGSAAATALTGGALRRVSDGSNNLTYDANRPLRRVTGMPIEYGGQGGVVRQLASNAGNIQVYYVRSPQKFDKPKDYPDPEIPVWIHKDLKFGGAKFLLRGSRVKIHNEKGKIASAKWEDLKYRVKSRIETSGDNMHMRAV